MRREIKKDKRQKERERERERERELPSVSQSEISVVGVWLSILFSLSLLSSNKSDHCSLFHLSLSNSFFAQWPL